MNKIRISKDSKIYVLSPAFHKTGGTELLHQYVNVLTTNNIDCHIVYPDATKDREINPAFRKYVDSYLDIKDVEDNQNNIIVLPETYTKYIRMFKNIRIIVWWESVDFYLKFKSFSYNFKRLFRTSDEAFGRLIRIMLRRFDNASYKELREKVSYHFVQSYYAEDFLKSLKIKDNVFYVSDYINDIYLGKKQYNEKEKEDFVCYNPAKGKKFTQLIIKKCPGVKFVPLVNMSNEQVFETLKKAKVYIDFGNHPGKDRFPREAAIMGCIVITNKEGAAGYHKDIPIDDKYKFDHKRSSLKRISKQIRACIADYENIIGSYENYRKMILSEKEQFFKNVLDCYEVN